MKLVDNWLNKKTGKDYFIFISLLLVTILFSHTNQLQVKAQTSTPTKWSVPVKISKSSNFAYTPFIIAGTNNSLYAAWSQNDLGLQPEDRGLDTIYLTYKQGDAWLEPNDILVADNNGFAVICRMRFDQKGTLYLLWVGRPGIFLSRASDGNTMSAKSWKTMRIGENAWSADFAISSDGRFHLIYIIDRQGIFYINSKDEGRTWSSPVSVWATPDESYSSGEVRLEVSHNILHAAWGVSSSNINWNTIGILYANSTDNGQTWENTLSVLGSNDHVAGIGFDSNGYIHIILNNPAGSSQGRGHVWSLDNGKSWRTVERIFPGYSGSTKWAAMANDSAGPLHLIFAANPPDEGEPRMFHAVWTNRLWEEPDLVSDRFVGEEGPSAAVTEGNIINVLWFSYNPQDYGIWYTQTQINAPRVINPTIPSTITAKSTSLPMNLNIPVIQITPTATPISIPIGIDRTTSIHQGYSSSTGFPIGVSVTTIIVMILLTLVVCKRKTIGIK